MATDWRPLFDSIRVAWTDRGANASRNNVNIQCPFCGSGDPSFHMAVSETGNGYYCFRNPSHSGRNPVSLLYQLGLKRDDAIQLINFYSGGGEAAHREPRPEVSKLQHSWQNFKLACDSDPIWNYLYVERGFADVEGLSEFYDLRYQPTGRFARRVLFPLKNGDGEIITWTGRTIDRDRQPRYLMQPVEYDGALYVPRRLRLHNFIVEGPMDGLKIAAALEGTEVASVGLIGLGVSTGRLEQLKRLRSQAPKKAKWYLALDRTLAVHTRRSLTDELRAAMRPDPIKVVYVPNGVKDPGEMSYGQLRRWATAALED